MCFVDIFKDADSIKTIRFGGPVTPTLEHHRDRYFNLIGRTMVSHNGQLQLSPALKPTGVSFNATIATMNRPSPPTA
jgi:hypothetical protein